MNSPEPDSLFGAYLQEWFPEEDEAYFDYKLRVLSEWDGAFHGVIDSIISLMTHPGFLALSSRGKAPEEYRRFLDERVRALRSLQEAYRGLERP